MGVNVKKTAKQWVYYHNKKGIAYLTYFWLFKEQEATTKKISEREYWDKYVHG